MVRKKQLFIDISELVNRDVKTGVQRVVRSVLSQLLQNPPSGYIVEPVYATLDSDGYYYSRKFMQKFSKIIDGKEDDLIQAENGDVFLGLDLQHHVVLQQKMTYQNLCKKGVEVYFVIYDLLPVLMPHAFDPSVEELHHNWLSILAENNGVICISKSVADEFKEWMIKKLPEKEGLCVVEWFHLGADVKASVPSTGMPKNAQCILDKISSGISFLMVGTIEPRKGHSQVLAAFDLLWEQGVEVNLVIVGKQGWSVEYLIEKIVKHSKYRECLFWLDGISDEYLEKVYINSSCLILASEGEGFGLPLIEAAQFQLPIIARDLPVFKEVAGKYAFYFENSKEPDTLAEAVLTWIELLKNKKYPKSDKMPWLTWKESTEQMIEKIIRG